MYHDRQGIEVWLVEDRRLVTSFHLDLPTDILVDEINRGHRHFKRFGGSGKLAAFVQAGRVIICPASQVHLSVERIKPQAEGHVLHEAGRDAYLTPRQSQVLAGVMDGQTLAEIGFRLGIRERSVRHHVDALKQRWGVVSLPQLVARILAGRNPESTPPQGGTGAGRQSKHPKIV